MQQNIDLKRRKKYCSNMYTLIVLCSLQFRIKLLSGNIVDIKRRMQMYIDILHSDFGFTYIAAAPGMPTFRISARVKYYHVPSATCNRYTEKIFRLSVSCVRRMHMHAKVIYLSKIGDNT